MVKKLLNLKKSWIPSSTQKEKEKIYEWPKTFLLTLKKFTKLWKMVFWNATLSSVKKRKKNVKKKKLKTIDILNSYSFSRQITEEMWKKWHFYLILGSTSEKKLENLEKFRIPVPFQRSFSLGKNGMSEKKLTIRKIVGEKKRKI